MPHKIPESMAEDLGAWSDGEGVSLETWVMCQGSFQLAIGYAAIFWPVFRTVGKYILHQDNTVDSIKGFESQQDSTPQGVEWVLNHIHLADLHIHDEEDLSADKLLVLGNTVKEMWAAKLHLQFPNRPCIVDFYVPDDPDDFWEYQVSFWQKAWDEETV